MPKIRTQPSLWTPRQKVAMLSIVTALLVAGASLVAYDALRSYPFDPRMMVATVEQAVQDRLTETDGKLQFCGFERNKIEAHGDKYTVVGTVLLIHASGSSNGYTYYCKVL